MMSCLQCLDCFRQENHFNETNITTSTQTTSLTPPPEKTNPEHIEPLTPPPQITNKDVCYVDYKENVIFKTLSGTQQTRFNEFVSHLHKYSVADIHDVNNAFYLLETKQEFSNLVNNGEKVELVFSLNNQIYKTDLYNILVVLVLLIHKFEYDFPFQNTSFATISCINLQSINLLELQILQILQFNLYSIQKNVQ
jgi:hypothetical protein